MDPELWTGFIYLFKREGSVNLHSHQQITEMTIHWPLLAVPTWSLAG